MRFPRGSRGDRSLTSQPRGPALSSAWASAATHMQPGEHALSEGGWGREDFPSQVCRDVKTGLAL